MKEANVGVIQNLFRVETSVSGGNSWSSCSSYRIYTAEEEGWIEEVHPTRPVEEHSVLIDVQGISIHWKCPDGINEPFFEILANRLSYSLGANVTPTFIVIFKKRVGIGSVGYYSTLLDTSSYGNFLSWSANTFLAEHFVFNVWWVNHDWGIDKFENYAINTSANGTFLGAYEFDKSHILFGPSGRFEPEQIHLLSENPWLGKCFFGYQIFFQNPEKAFEAVKKIESLSDSTIYKIAMSVSRLLGRAIPELKSHYRELSLASCKVLIARKRKIRKWVEDLFSLNPQFAVSSLIPEAC